MTNSSTQSQHIVQKLYSFCNVLRDHGLSYGDYLQQLTYLLFLKMAHERTLSPHCQSSAVPEEYAWPTLLALEGNNLTTHYRRTLEVLGKKKGMLGIIFRKAQNKIDKPALLRRLIVDLIDRERWTALEVDVKGEAYEGLLQKYAEDTKSGAGQYFTPRPLIQAIVDAIHPKPKELICDPACGTGGFLLNTRDYISTNYALDGDQQEHLHSKALHGWEIVPDTARLCAMNFMLHNIGGDALLIRSGEDALAKPAGMLFDVVLSNPPFGKKSSITIVNEEGDEGKETLSYHRDDFWATTNNKQLNFIQHIKTLLNINGRAAVVVPDNVLFEGGVGETIRRKLLHECDLHTLLRLPTGIFYKQGVKANVLFFDRKPASEHPWTKALWIYDFRTNKQFSRVVKPLQREDLNDFVLCYNPASRHERIATWNIAQPEGRWRAYTYQELLQRDKVSLDIFWLRDDSLTGTSNLPAPHIIAAEIVEDLQSALEQFALVAEDLYKKYNTLNI